MSVINIFIIDNFSYTTGPILTKLYMECTSGAGWVVTWFLFTTPKNTAWKWGKLFWSNVSRDFSMFSHLYQGFPAYIFAKRNHDIFFKASYFEYRLSQNKKLSSMQFLAHLSLLLRVSYCDHWMSVVRHVSSVVNNCLKRHLLLNYLLDFDQTW